jgi:hypothetical protein
MPMLFRSGLLQTKANTCNSTILLSIKDSKSKQAKGNNAKGNNLPGATKKRNRSQLPDVDPCLGSTLDSVHRKLALIKKETTQIIVCRCGAQLNPHRRFEELRAILPILVPAKKYTCLKWNGLTLNEHMHALKVCASPERRKQNVLALAIIVIVIHKIFSIPSAQRPNLAFLRYMRSYFLTWSISFA